MSLILEALRKSEAERRRAQVPDLLTEAQAAAPVAARATPRWPLWAGGAVVVLALAWLALPRDGAAPVDAAAETPTDAASPEADPTASPANAVASRAPAPARSAPTLQRPLVVAAPTPAVPAETNAPPATAVPVATTPTPATAPRPDPVAANATRTSAPPPRAEPVAAAPAPALASPTAVERVTDLGNADRKQLPPLKLSMHMWNDVVARRFVIIDGNRLGVGDRLGAVVVADIVPDGVLLDWNGRALKLPLR